MTKVMEIWVAVGNGADNANCTTAVNLLATDDEYDPDNPMTCSIDDSNPAVTIDWAVGAEDMIDNSQDAGYDEYPPWSYQHTILALSQPSVHT